MNSVMAAYQQKFINVADNDSGPLIEDPGQHALAKRMDELLEACENASSSRSLWSRFVKKQPPLIKGLYIHGPVGRGKSMMMNLLVSVAGTGVRRLHYAQWTSQLHALMTEARAQGLDPVKHVVQKFSEGTRLVCVDELEIRDITDAMLLSRVMQGLFEEGLILVSTSNTAPDDLYKDGLNRALFLPFVEAIKQHCDVVTLDYGEDYRRRHLTEAGVWQQRVSEQANSSYEALWQDWAKVHDVSEHDLSIQGRTLTVTQAGPALRCPARRLFQENRGSSDYTALARGGKVLFLDELTPFSMPDQARRFVLAVDVFYELGLVLVVDALVPPADLFQDQQNLGFARTLSRLQEMQSEQWVAKLG